MNHTITFSSKWSDTEFEQMIARKLRIRFPRVTFGHVQDSSDSEGAWSAWENNEELDIRIDFCPIPHRENYDISSLLADGLIDTATFAPGLLASLSDHQGGIFGLPFDRGTAYAHALFYNADIFGRFGVPVPEHGMSWDEVIALARRVTGIVDGTAYYGLDIGDPALLKMQLGLTFLDPITHKPRLREPDCQEFFRIVREAYSIPGNLQASEERLFIYGRAFRRKGNVAMSIDSPEMFYRKIPFQLGAVTYPSALQTKRVPSLGGDPWYLALHPKSMSKQLAIEAMCYLVSPEFQINMARMGRFPALLEHMYEEHYAQDLSCFAGRPMAWIFQQGEKVGWPHHRSPYERQAAAIIVEEMRNTVREDLDWTDSINLMEKRIMDEVL